MKLLFLFLFLSLLFSGCAVLESDATHREFVAAGGPDTTQKFDATGHPNFGPARK